MTAYQAPLAVALHKPHCGCRPCYVLKADRIIALHKDLAEAQWELDRAEEILDYGPDRFRAGAQAAAGTFEHVIAQLRRELIDLVGADRVD